MSIIFWEKIPGRWRRISDSGRVQPRRAYARGGDYVRRGGGNFRERKRGRRRKEKRKEGYAAEDKLRSLCRAGLEISRTQVLAWLLLGGRDGGSQARFRSRRPPSHGCKKACSAAREEEEL